ncbi:MAG: prohibitin family protein [Oscillospiraceae bacterium]|nr:prohibitin family protein [Oscillospiraceae bacterium]
MGKKYIPLILTVAALGLLAVLFLNCTTQVPTGYTGILTTFGKVEGVTLEAGFHFRSPFQKIILMDNREQKRTFTTQAFSSDIQQVDIQGSVNFNINKSTAMTLLREVGTDYFNTLILPRLLENIKAVFSKYSAEKLIAARDTLSLQVRTVLSGEMEHYGINVINISLEDIDFTDAFTNAVEEKQVAEQTKLRVETEQAQQTSVAEAEARRRVITAEAELSAAQKQAEAEAYAIRAKAQAESEANQLLAGSITAPLIEYVKWSGWNGQWPSTMVSGDAALPVLNLGEGSVAP